MCTIPMDQIPLKLICAFLICLLAVTTKLVSCDYKARKLSPLRYLQLRHFLMIQPTDIFFLLRNFCKIDEPATNAFEHLALSIAPVRLKKEQML
jgi:hypothetical protein